MLKLDNVTLVMIDTLDDYCDKSNIRIATMSRVLPKILEEVEFGDIISINPFNKNSNLFNDGEKAQLQRLIDYIEVVKRGHNRTELDMDLQFHDFKSFYTQYDIRRNKNFVETFPELTDWYNSIEIDQSIKLIKMHDGKLGNWEVGEYVSDNKF